jgi:choline transport protein
VKKVRTRVPRSIVLTCIVNSISLVVFATVLLFFMGPLTDDITNSALPILVILAKVTNSSTCANILVSCLAITNFLALFNYFASVSRLIWVFARDNGLPFSSFFAYVRIPASFMSLSH